MISYTRKEIKTINDAWSSLVSLTDEYRYDVKHRLLLALKIDTKERERAEPRGLLSKAILIRCVMYAGQPNKKYLDNLSSTEIVVRSVIKQTLDGLECQPHGCLLASLIGHRLQSERPEGYKRILSQLQSAIEANKAAYTQHLLNSCKGNQ